MFDISSVGAALVFTMLIPGVLSTVSAALRPVPGRARALACRLRSWAQGMLTLGGELETHQLPAVFGGGLLITAASVMLIVCGWNLMAPALAPVLGLDAADLEIAWLGRATVGALLVVPAIAGAYLTDLAGWSQITAVGRQRRGRTRAVLIASATFAWGLSALLALGGYRAVLGLDLVLGVERSEYYASHLAAWVVTSADALVLLGIYLGLPSFDDVVRLGAATVAAALSVTMALIALVVDSVQAVVVPICNALKVVQERMVTVSGAAAASGAKLASTVLEIDPDRSREPEPRTGQGPKLSLGPGPSQRPEPAVAARSDLEDAPATDLAAFEPRQVTFM